MNNSPTPIIPPAAPRKTHHWKWKIYLALIFIFLGLGAYCYFSVQSANQLRSEARAALTQAEKFDALFVATEKEFARCKDFVSQKGGDFRNFEYCQGFIGWATPLLAP